MIATIEGDLRGTKVIKSDKGTFYQHNIEMRGKDGVPYNVMVMSETNSQKPGKVSMRVNISMRRNKEKQITGLKMWEVKANV